MWNRYLLRCSNCGKVTNLRVAIEGNSRQIIKFSCPNCKSIIGGVLEIDYEKITFNLTPTGCTIIPGAFDEGDYFAEYSEGLPVSKPNTNGHVLLTPFMRTIRMSKGRDDFLYKQQYYQSIKEDDWTDLENFNRAFIEKNFSLMKKIASKYRFYNREVLDKDIEIYVNKILFEINYTFLYPFLDETELKRNMELIDKYIEERRLDTNTINFIDHLINNGYVDRWLREIFDDLKLFIENREKFRPAVFYPLSSISDQQLLGEFISTEYFLGVRNIYTNIFETQGRLLSIFYGMDNVDERGKYDLINHNKDIKKWKDFFSISNGKKIQYLSNNPLWKSILKDTFDSKLRNGINHNKAVINLDTQIISYYPNKNSDEEYKISYYEFIYKILISFRSLFYFLLFLLKLIDFYKQSKDL